MDAASSPRETVPSRSPDALIIAAFARIDAIALGIALGVSTGAAVAAVTLFLVGKGGALVGPHLQLLSQFFVGYSVTPVGSLIGAAYGAAYGFLLGWTAASLRNGLLRLYLVIVKLRARLSSLQDYIDP